MPASVERAEFEPRRLIPGAKVIPEAKQPAVARALKEAFGVQEFEDIRRLTAGLNSAMVFRIVVRRRPYLLRVITRTDDMSDPTRQFACMKSGAESRIAPRVLYASIKDRVSITDFVEARPLSAEQALVRLPGTLRTLHSLPPFPKAKAGNYFDMVDRFISRLAKSLPESLTRELSELYSRVAHVYPRYDESDWVSCHNDLKPENILFDGDRVWLVDWEAAFLNDPYVDLAVVANFAVNSDADEQAYLQRYFGEPAGEYRLARFFLMRQVAHIFYAMVFLSLAAAAGKAIDMTIDSIQDAPDFRGMHRRILAGEVSLADADAKLQYGLVHLKQIQQNMQTPRFQDALQIVSNAEPHSGG
jgi:aminoglycoside phosphotransferase (APT) family kinase protein